MGTERVTSDAERWTSEGQTTLPGLLARTTAQWPDRPFLQFEDNAYTYAEFGAAVERMARCFVDLEVSPGDRVCCLMDNSDDMILVWFAVTRLGAVWVPLNTALKGEFLRHQLADSGASIFICERDFVDRLAPIEAQLPELVTVIIRGGPTDDQQAPRYRSFDVLKQPSSSTLPQAEAGPGDLAMIIYTSGTTGLSKGCMIPHNYFCNVAGRLMETTDRTETDVVLSAMPLFHLGALTNLVLLTLTAGAKAVVRARFSLSNFWSEVEKYGATNVNLIGAMLSLIANAPDTEVSRRCFGKIRSVLGTPFTPELVEIWKRRFGVKIAGNHSFGMTEAVPIAYRRLGHERPGASGQISPDFEVRLVDENGEECRPGEPGELMVRPRKPNIMFSGYWRRPAETLALMRDLWFHTGDIVRIDEDRFLYFVDRGKDYLRKGGENISSFEMESVFVVHPEIAEVAVHSVPSEHTEDELKVTAVLHPDSALSEEALCRWVIDKVPYFAVPRFIEFRESLPRTATGRIRKAELRFDGVTYATWDRAKSDVSVSRR